MKNTKVKKQLNSIYFSAILIPILVIGAFLIINTYHLLMNHYENQTEADNSRVKSIMFDCTTNMYNISDDIFADKELQKLLAKRYSSRQESDRACNNYAKMNNYMIKNTLFSSIELYTPNTSITKYGCFKPVTSEIQKESWYQSAVEQSSILWKSIQRIDQWKHTSQELCLIRRIPIISTNEYAVLVIRLSNNYLKNRIQTSNMSTTITVNNDPIFFSTERTLSGSLLQIPADYRNNKYYTGQLTYRENNGIACINTLLPYASNNRIYLYTIDYHALSDTRNIILYCITIIILASVLPLIIINMFTNKFSSRIITLRGEMHKASNGDYHIIDTFNGNDEISEVFSDLKVMIQSIKKMDSEMYEAKIKEQELKNQQQKMEFKMLSSQINPHFLYNTLETIRMKAFTAGNKDVADAIKLLGKSMHYVLENTGASSTTLKRELDYISTYLSIQKLRFSDRVNYNLHITDDLVLEEYPILPLLLQPIVENAILHGLEDTESNGNVTIDVMTKNDEYLMITIIDNGKGMTEEDLDQLRKTIQLRKKSTSSSIGLHNINQRIKLFYGDAYGMEIDSKLNEGTQIIVKLPLHGTMEE